ncbi:MAG TPA: S4 domain-containing protein [Steroidobacteraceae bacterium]|nr:S4 domain-containing protein [Steroidobacteraceae bacterium]
MRRAGGSNRPGGPRGGRRGRAHGERHASSSAQAARSGARQEAERVQKVLARAGLASRREAEAWIRAGRLTINGAVATLGARIAPGDELRLDGRTVHARAPQDPQVFLCHRSPGEPLIEPGPLPRRLGRRLIAVSPMPRADGGLELLSTDGELAARLQRAVHALASEFSVRVRGELSDTQIRGILGGELDSGAQLAIESCESAGGEAANRWYRIAARGASGREMRQLLERQAVQVSRLLRTRLGPIFLERALGRGRSRELSQEELRALLPEDAASAAEDARAGG